MSKLTSAWLAGVAILLAVIATALRQANVTRDAVVGVAHTYETLAALDATLADLREAEGAQRGYLLTGAPAYLEQHARAAARAAAGLAVVRQVVRGADRSHASDESRARVARAEPFARVALDQMARSVRLARAGRAGAGVALIRPAAAATERVRAEFDALRRAERARLAERTAALERAASRTERVTWCAVALLLVFAPLGYLAIAAELRARRRAADALAEQSITDALTGLLNRRGLDRVGAHALAHAARAHEPALLLYLDMNGFKPINDECGHAAGDAALCDTAAALRSVFRDGDVIARVGGDEFVVLACDAGPRDAAVLARRIDDALHTRSWGDAPYAPRRLRASIGWSAFDPAHPADLAALVHKADASMYAVKHLARVAA